MKESFYTIVLPMELLSLFLVMFVVMFAFKAHEDYKKTGEVNINAKFLLNVAGNAFGFVAGLALSVVLWLYFIW